MNDLWLLLIMPIGALVIAAVVIYANSREAPRRRPHPGE